MTEPRRLAVVPALVFLLGDATWAQAPEARSGNTTVHLADILPGARVESPLLELPVANDLDDLDDPAIDLLLEETFELFEPEYVGWPTLSQVSVAEEGENHVLRLEGPAEGLGWALPVREDAFYRFRRAVRVEGRAFCDFYVVESADDLVDGFDPSAFDSDELFLPGRGSALKVHKLPFDDDALGEWQKGSTTFYPTPRTRSLVVLARPRVAPVRGGGTPVTSFDDIVLEEVLPGREDRIRLLKGASGAPDADPALGMRKAGWLLPLPNPRGVEEGEAPELNYAWRRALYAPPTTELTFQVTIPAGGRLVLATGLARETPPRAAARFQVELRAEGAEEPEVLLDQVRTARMSEWGWEESELDLASWAGQEGSLTLRTLAESGDPHPLWADPRVEGVATADDPLVILIAVDTLRADRLSAYGYGRETSPALERLAADGVLFEQARSNSNWTCPSFASIFTGLVPARHGVSSYGPATPLPDELVTLAEHFQAAGWETRSIAYKVPLFDGNYEQGFDQAFNMPRDFIRGEENLARALEWLREPRGGPAFLFLHFNDPHQPFVHPEPLDREFGGAAAKDGVEVASIPEGSQQEAQEQWSNLYDGAVAYVDSCIGAFLDALRERGLYERATIAFVADHGEELFERGNFGHGGTRLHDEVVRVPLIVKPPAGTAKPGGVVRAEVSGFDVMPTLLVLAGLPVPADLDALSLVPLIDGRREARGQPVVTESSVHGLAVVDGGWKLIVPSSGGQEVLYHLASDPLETEDLAEERPEEVARLRALAIAYVLGHRPGNYLLVRTGEEPATLRTETSAVRLLVGPYDAPPGGRGLQLPARTWVLIGVDDGTEGERLEVSGIEPRGPATGFAPWGRRSLASLDGRGLWRFHGPSGTAPVVTEDEPVDLEVLEALRRLGYAE